MLPQFYEIWSKPFEIESTPSIFDNENTPTHTLFALVSLPTSIIRCRHFVNP